MNEKALVAMSGGVDSAVAAYLMQQSGYDVTGVIMRLLQHGDALPAQWDDAVLAPPFHENTPEIQDAAAIARQLGISFAVCHLEADFCKHVVDPFVKSYLDGATPNPCIFCNKAIKFGRLLDYATAHSIGTVATGHYAVITKDANGRYGVRRAKDEKKDQTYMFWSLTQDVLSRVRFPLGELCKEEVRAIAAEQGLCAAAKRDSQDICFIPDGDYATFVQAYSNASAVPGDFVDVSGNPLGRHNGLLHYTIGQRKGLGIAFGQPMYVGKKEASTNRITLCTDRELYGHALTAHSINWLPFDRLSAPLRVQAKIRYQHATADATVEPLSNTTVRVVFDQPQRAIARGQSVVFYDGDILLGGGIIEDAEV